MKQIRVPMGIAYSHTAYIFDPHKNFFSFNDLSKDLDPLYNQWKYIGNCTFEGHHVFAKDIKSFANHVAIDHSIGPVKDTFLDNLVEGNRYRFRAGSSVCFLGEIVGVFAKENQFLLIKVLSCDDVYLTWRIKNKILHRLEVICKIEKW